jgi:hypothetical protein
VFFLTIISNNFTAYAFPFIHILPDPFSFTNSLLFLSLTD